MHRYSKTKEYQTIRNTIFNKRGVEDKDLVLKTIRTNKPCTQLDLREKRKTKRTLKTLLKKVDSFTREPYFFLAISFMRNLSLDPHVRNAECVIKYEKQA